MNIALLEAERILGDLERAELESVKILNVPFLGIAFDVNDLGLLAGIAFMTLLLLRKMSLNTERDGLRLLFRRSYHGGCLRDAYDLTAMGQVLTVPVRAYDPCTPLRRGIVGMYRMLPVLLDFVPAALLLAIFYSNLTTERAGMMISPTNTTLSLVASGVLFLIVLALTCLCTSAELQIHQLMDVAAFGDEEQLQKLLECGKPTELPVEESGRVHGG